MLTAIEIDALLPRATTHKSTGVHKLRVYRENDGGSLYLIVYPSGGKAWEFRYKRAGKAQAVILGVYGTAPGKMGPKAARTERDRRKGSIASGLDPKSEKAINAEAQRDTLAAKQAAREQREAEKARAQVDTARLALTFRVVADAWVADGRADWPARNHGGNRELRAGRRAAPDQRHRVRRAGEPEGHPARRRRCADEGDRQQRAHGHGAAVRRPGVPRGVGPGWAATIILAGRTTNMMAGSEESEAA